MTNYSLYSPGREQALAFRLDSHYLSRRLPHGSLLQAAGACALQNTPPGSAELALHARVGGLAPGDIQRALEVDKTLLQAWSLRASPYIFPASDAATFMLGVLPRREDELRAYIPGVEPALEKIGISAVQAVELAAAEIAETLRGGALTKDELGILISQAITPHLTKNQEAAWRSPSWYAPGQSLGESVVRFVLPILALKGLCCHADRRGNKAYIMLTHQWLQQSLPGGDPDQARAGLARRYLHCYGPSTVEHFAEWAGISTGQAAHAWQLVDDEQVEVDLKGRRIRLLREDLPRLKSPPQPTGARLLPPHDQLLSMRDRETLVPDKMLQRKIWLRSGNPGVVLIDGKLTALWRPSKRGRQLGIIIHTFFSLSQKFRSLIHTEAETLAPLRGCTEIEVNFTDVT